MNKTMIKACCVILLIAVCLLASCSFAACKHQWVTYKVVKATCTDVGIDYMRCSKCGEEDTEIHLPDLSNHNYKETSRVNANCSKEGYINYKCTRCNGTKRTTLKKNSVHDYKSYKIDKATCTEKGKEYFKCTRCGKEKTTTLKALGHDKYGYNELEPTCLVPGRKMTFCSRCGYIHSCTTIPKTSNHTWVSDGFNYKCKVCKKVHQDNEHNYVYSSTIRKPTCALWGLEERRCTICKKTAQFMIDKTTNHSFTAWSVQTKATVRSEGKKARYCKICGLTEWQTIPKLTKINSSETYIN